MRPETRNDIIGWDTATWGRALELWEPELQQFNAGEFAVEVGARSGGLALLFALKGFKSISSDIVDPSTHGQAVHSKYKVGNSITYLMADATSLPFKSNQVTIAGMKSVLGSVARDENFHRARSAVDEVYRILKPGGVFLFAENLRASALHMYLRRKFVSWASHYYYFTFQQFDDLLAEFSEVRYESCGFTALAGRSESQRQRLASVDKLLHPLTPKRWRYLAYGYARK